MLKKKDIEKRVAKMKRGDYFHVSSEPERQAASRCGTILRRAGMVDFTVYTEQQGNKFLVEAR